MVNEKPGSESEKPEEEKDNPEGTETGTPFDKLSETHTSADGTKTEMITGEIDYKKKYEDEIKAHNLTRKEKADLEAYHK